MTKEPESNKRDKRDKMFCREEEKEAVTGGRKLSRLQLQLYNLIQFLTRHKHSSYKLQFRPLLANHSFALMTCPPLSNLYINTRHAYQRNMYTQSL